MERGLIADRTKAGLEVVKRQGRHVGRPPYGFVMDEENKGVLIPIEADIAVARDIIQQYRSGNTVKDIIDVLASRGILTPTGKHRWNHPSVKKVIDNESLYH